ncbi:MAG: polysaccharide deacetylase family protein [Planctomycetota bacterium]
MYHKILPRDEAAKYPLKNLVVTDDVFEAQVQWLAEHAHCTTLRDAMKAGTDSTEVTAVTASNGNGRAASADRPTVVLTFDDGYLDNAEIAAPILDRHGVPGTFFLATDFIEGTPLWFDRAALLFTTVPGAELQQIVEERLNQLDSSSRPIANQRLDAWMGSLKRVGKDTRDSVLDAVEQATGLDGVREWRFRPMSVDQVREMHNRGHEVASHTVTHPILPELDPDQQHRELAESRSRIESWIGAPVEGICYPNGDFDDHTLTAARSCGYTYGCVTDRGRHDPARDDAYRVRRRMISQSNTTNRRDRLDPAIFRAEVAGVFESIKRLKP